MESIDQTKMQEINKSMKFRLLKIIKDATKPLKTFIDYKLLNMSEIFSVNAIFSVFYR